MEYGLRLDDILVEAAGTAAVLILVVMEYGLRRKKIQSIVAWIKSLNPCCNGIWSQTLTGGFRK